MQRRDVFQAIADPTRREIISIISKQSLNLNAVADNFNISRPAISKHIKILTECGLIVIKKQGRERYCEANLQPLGQVSGWVEQYRTFWTAKLDALEQFLSKETVAAKRGGRNAITKPSKKSKRK
ncbi:MAG TPA: metalloregulator ArsR/SmtB family transcription factor [Chitinophagaceae bacterium]|nr:metalloregulator ArsR/SmtB family transcription factor [Chitinophagaceae bacterium]